MNTKEELIHHLENESKVLGNPRAKKAFESTDRADFVPEDYKCEAYEDYAVPIGHGGTISQPTTVAFMLELLSPEDGDNVLDVGSGSGWTTALLASFVGEKGFVRGVEIIPELVKFGQENIAKYNLKNAVISKAENKIGLVEYAPYDRILVSAEAEKIPDELVKELKPGGVMVIPIGNSIVKVTKGEDNKIETKNYPGFVFVPLQY